MKSLEELIDDVTTKGGVIVSSNECKASEITAAQVCNRYHAIADGTGLVRRPKTWLEQIYAEQ